MGMKYSFSVIIVSILLLKNAITYEFHIHNSNNNFLENEIFNTTSRNVPENEPKCNENENTMKTYNLLEIQKMPSPNVNFSHNNFGENSVDSEFVRIHKYVQKQASKKDIFERKVVGKNFANEISNTIDTPEIGKIPLQRKTKYEITTKSYLIKLLLVLDQSMVNSYGQNLLKYIWDLFYDVNKILEHESFGSPVRIALLEPILPKTTFGTKNYTNGIDVNVLLDNFCKWQKQKRKENAYENFNIALFLTRDNFCSYENQKFECSKIGLSDVGTICNNHCRACAVIQDLGSNSATTITHEIGHLLGMHHDSDNECKHFQEPLSSKSLMHTVPSGKDLKLSECSEYYLQNLRISGGDHCLTNHEPKFPRIIDFRKWLLSNNLNVNKQCLFFDRPKKANIGNNLRECGIIYCKLPGSKTYYPLPSLVADRTLCVIDKRCLEKDCKEGQKLKAIDGGWGSWSPYGPCTRPCGVGIQRSTRKCNNPVPQNGGTPCKGNSLKISPCGTQECPDGHKGPREEQCAEKRNNNYDLDQVPQKVEWQAYYNRGKNPCQTACRVKGTPSSFTFDEIVVDGTKCYRGSSDICIAGRCMKFGCDNVIDSSARFDICRVCDGDNSTCRKVSGSININNFNGKGFGYHDLAKIPAESHSINIELEDENGSLNEKNCLALKIGNKYILDGEHLGKHALFVFKEPGLPIKYDNFVTQRETLRSSGPIKVDLVVQVDLKNKNDYFVVNYEYVVPKKYQWVFESWVDCGLMCPGQQKSIFKCQDLDTGDFVSDEKCSALQKPPDKFRRKTIANKRQKQAVFG